MEMLSLLEELDSSSWEWQIKRSARIKQITQINVCF